jgi:hypothetical protein
MSLLATITLKVVPFHTYALFPVLLPFFECILKIVLCEGVQHCLRSCLDCVKILCEQFPLISENDEHAHDFSLHFPLEGLLLYLRVITINPVLGTSDNPYKKIVSAEAI